jgi:GNAT superfamily N-acetyltransferase
VTSAGTATVRLAGRGDAVVLHLLGAATFPLACPPSTPAADIAAFVAKELSVERFRRRLESDRRTLFIGEISGTPAGYAMVSHHDELADDVAALLTCTPTVELSKFYLLAGRHGSGLADLLMRAAIAEARERGAASMWLGADPGNSRANSFYDKYGFARRGLKKFQVGSRSEDDIIRELVL